MKKIFKYLGIVLSVALMGAFTACQVEKENESADLGLGIKVFFPTKVVAGQPMTINGSGFSDVREIVFPGDVSVTGFELVSDEMIRVIAPSGISSNGGKISVISSTDRAESRMPLTLGNTVVSGYSKQDGEEIEGGQQLTIYGEDLEFITGVELLNADGEPEIIGDELFYRKGTSTVIINIPKKVFEGVYIGKLFTYDGKQFALPELSYKPASDGGHWETVKKSLWKNDGTGGPINWNGTYRFALEGHDGNNECIAELPADVWNLLMTDTFYIEGTVDDASWYQVRLTNGWWDVTWKGSDVNMGDERIVINEDGSFFIEINLTDDPDFIASLEEKHLLFTGAGWTLQEIYTSEDVWVDGGGHMEIVKEYFWKNEGAGPINWNGTYRFGLDGHDGNNECIATFGEDIWNKILTETFYLEGTVDDASWYQIRLTNGWWDVTWKGSDVNMGDERIVINEDGSFYVEVNLADDPDFIATLEEKHLLFTGAGWTLQGLYFQKEEWVGGGGDSGPKQDVFWQNEGAGAVSWNGTYRFALEGHDGNNECIAEFPQDVWDKIKSGKFFLVVEATDPQIRVTNGWWDTQWQSDFQPGNELLTDNGDGTWTLEINIAGDPLADTIDEKHILFTGDRFTPVKLYF